MISEMKSGPNIKHNDLIASDFFGLPAETIQVLLYQ
jgi:hypothetical protein